MTPQIVRALDPLDGDEIYLAENGGWTRDPQAASRALTGPEAAALLAVAGMQPDVAEDPRLAPAPAPRRRISRPSGAGAWPAAAAAAR